jgi:hypothetical protein
MSDRKLPAFRPRQGINDEETVIVSLLMTYRELADTPLHAEKLRRFLTHKIGVQKNRLALRMSLTVHN